MLENRNKESQFYISTILHTDPHSLLRFHVLLSTIQLNLTSSSFISESKKHQSNSICLALNYQLSQVAGVSVRFLRVHLCRSIFSPEDSD